MEQQSEYILEQQLFNIKNKKYFKKLIVYCYSNSQPSLSDPIFQKLSDYVHPDHRSQLVHDLRLLIQQLNLNNPISDYIQDLSLQQFLAETVEMYRQQFWQQNSNCRIEGKQQLLQMDWQIQQMVSQQNSQLNANVQLVTTEGQRIQFQADKQQVAEFYQQFKNIKDKLNKISQT